MDKPLLLIDVDGVISLFGFDPARAPAGRFELVDGIAHFISATAGAHLRALSGEFELVWCSGWEEKANDYLPRSLALPGALAYLTFPRENLRTHAHWKLAAIDSYARPERQLAWIDDGHDEHCHAWASSRSAPTLLVTTDSAVGIADEQVAELLSWRAALPFG